MKQDIYVNGTGNMNSVIYNLDANSDFWVETERTNCWWILSTREKGEKSCVA